ncbi:MAG: hypothetical protein LEGION0398_MBIBDBAK_01401 [Legionellaceae bacterium]
MPLKLSLTRQALKELEKLPKKHFLQIDRKIAELRITPFPQDTKKLKGYVDFYRVDSGEYRIIYRVDNALEILYVAAIGKRNDSEVYRQFNQ